VSYYKILGLETEPFSTSPDPEFFYQSKEHKSALYRLRVAIELKRGLSLVLGDVGTGKTTLSRKLSQLLKADSELIMTMVLNPIYESEKAISRGPCRPFSDIRQHYGWQPAYDPRLSKGDRKIPVRKMRRGQ